MSLSRDDLVEAIIAAGVIDERLIGGFRTIPRTGFVPESSRHLAYEDRPIAIAHDQVTTQPSLSAVMIEALELTPSSRVLEVGTGLGFQTALLAHMAGEVVSVELWEDLAEEAGSNLKRMGITNVEIHVGDGSIGVPGSSPFDAIIVSAAFTDVPDSLANQLIDGGRLVQPIGPGGNEMVTLYLRTRDALRRIRSITPARFVRLVGREAFSPKEGRGRT